ncbi:MAG: nucleotidyltransferase family protein [Aestuariivirgaceae bacterium]
MSGPSERTTWTAVVLAAGRGKDDPLAAHFGVSHKCLLPVGGRPMLQRVVATLAGHPSIGDIIVSIEDQALLPQALGKLAGRVAFAASRSSAARSAAAAVQQSANAFPILLTTADHALLDQDMLSHFLEHSTALGCDLTVGVASAETILAAYPDAKRTFLTFGPDRVSGCNLYGLRTASAERVLELWQSVEENRKNPLAIVRAFGLYALLRYVTKTITLESAFAIASRRLRLTAKPVVMPFANAAVDVDKPADKELVENILRQPGEKA